MHKVDVNDILKSIWANAEIALNVADFTENVNRIHLACHAIEERVYRFESAKLLEKFDMEVLV